MILFLGNPVFPDKCAEQQEHKRAFPETWQ